jgi:FAD/FMN-containing dehydrogenase
MNDAMEGQPVFESYGLENFQRLQAAKEAYDPTGFFTTGQGGFKIQQ